MTAIRESHSDPEMCDLGIEPMSLVVVPAGDGGWFVRQTDTDGTVFERRYAWRSNAVRAYRATVLRVASEYSETGNPTESTWWLRTDVPGAAVDAPPLRRRPRMDQLPLWTTEDLGSLAAATR